MRECDPLVESWQIHDRINLYLLEAVPSGGLDAKEPSGGRTVAQAFGHMHNVRLMWLQAAGASVPKSVTKLDLQAPQTAAKLSKALNGSGAAITALIEASLAAGGRVKGFKPHVHAFVGYLISHESHHRGQVVAALKANGTPVEKKVAFGIWEWGVR